MLTFFIFHSIDCNGNGNDEEILLLHNIIIDAKNQVFNLKRSKSCLKKPFIKINAAQNKANRLIDR